MNNLEYRFWVLDAANKDNRLAEINTHIKNETHNDAGIVAIVDEEQGGIIAYALEPFAEKIVESLNSVGL